MSLRKPSIFAPTGVQKKDAVRLGKMIAQHPEIGVALYEGTDEDGQPEYTIRFARYSATQPHIFDVYKDKNGNYDYLKIASILTIVAVPIMLIYSLARVLSAETLIKSIKLEGIDADLQKQAQNIQKLKDDLGEAKSKFHNLRISLYKLESDLNKAKFNRDNNYRGLIYIRSKIKALTIRDREPTAQEIKDKNKEQRSLDQLVDFSRKTCSEIDDLEKTRSDQKTEIEYLEGEINKKTKELDELTTKFNTALKEAPKDLGENKVNLDDLTKNEFFKKTVDSLLTDFYREVVSKPHFYREVVSKNEGWKPIIPKIQFTDADNNKYEFRIRDKDLGLLGRDDHLITATIVQITGDEEKEVFTKTFLINKDEFVKNVNAGYSVSDFKKGEVSERDRSTEVENLDKEFNMEEEENEELTTSTTDNTVKKPQKTTDQIVRFGYIDPVSSLFDDDSTSEEKKDENLELAPQQKPTPQPTEQTPTTQVIAPQGDTNAPVLSDEKKKKETEEQTTGQTATNTQSAAPK